MICKVVRNRLQKFVNFIFLFIIFFYLFITCNIIKYCTTCTYWNLCYMNFDFEIRFKFILSVFACSLTKHLIKKCVWLKIIIKKFISCSFFWWKITKTVSDTRVICPKTHTHIHRENSVQYVTRMCVVCVCRYMYVRMYVTLCHLKTKSNLFAPGYFYLHSNMFLSISSSF